MSMNMDTELWRFASDLSVVDAAILLGGGDPGEKDWEDNGTLYGERYQVQRTKGHPGFTAMFSTLANAVREGSLPAAHAHRAEPGGWVGSSLHGDIWIISRSDIELLRSRLDADPFDQTPFGGAYSIRVQTEPDWTKTMLAVRDLKTWLSKRGLTKNFFFPPEPAAATDAFSDPSHPRFCPELDFAMRAWRAMADEEIRTGTPKQAVERWMKQHKEEWRGRDALEVGSTQWKRIATMVNWQPEGGAGKTGG
ncbi:hypothetical protein [Haematobacter missouriensis]|nr:hypothetical protein [Haematobacter missouriensis]